MEDKQGFTLIEIILALVIVGILAAVALPNLTGSMEQTRAQAAKNNLLAIAAAQSKFNEDYSSYCSNNNIATCYCINTAPNFTGVTTTYCGDTNSDLNSNLHLGIPGNDTFTYSCTNAASPYQCTAGDNTLTLTLNVTATGASVSCAPAGNPNCPS